MRGSTFEANRADARGGGHPADRLNSSQPAAKPTVRGIDAIQNAPSTSRPARSTTTSPTPPPAPRASGGFAFGGGALLEIGSAPTSMMTNVTFTRNVARTHASRRQPAGWRHLLRRDNPGQPLTNATLTANSAAGGGTNQGGNIFVADDAAATIENTVIASGAADAGSENCGAGGALVLARQQHRQPRSMQLPRRRRRRQHGSPAWATCEQRRTRRDGCAEPRQPRDQRRCDRCVPGNRRPRGAAPRRRRLRCRRVRDRDSRALLPPRRAP